MPYGFGNFRAGRPCSSMMDVAIRDALYQYYTRYQATWNWPPPFVPILPDVSPPGVMLAYTYHNYDDQSAVWPGALWTAHIVQQCGLTALVQIDALYLTGMGLVQTIPSIGVEDPVGLQTHQSWFTYSPGDSEPPTNVAVWGGLIFRSDYTAWNTQGTGEPVLWCALPGYVSVGAWESSNAAGGPPFVPALTTLTPWIRLPRIYIQVCLLPQGKIGSPDVMVPLGYAIVDTTGELPAYGHIWDQIRTSDQFELDAVELMDSREYNGYNSPSWSRLGKAGDNNPYIR